VTSDSRGSCESPKLLALTAAGHLEGHSLLLAFHDKTFRGLDAELPSCWLRQQPGTEESVPNRETALISRCAPLLVEPIRCNLTT